MDPSPDPRRTAVDQLSPHELCDLAFTSHQNKTQSQLTRIQQARRMIRSLIVNPTAITARLSDVHEYKLQEALDEIRESGDLTDIEDAFEVVFYNDGDDWHYLFTGDTTDLRGVRTTVSKLKAELRIRARHTAKAEVKP